MTRPTPREPTRPIGREKGGDGARETGRSMRTKYRFSRRRGPCGGGRSGGTLGEGGGEDEAGKRTREWDWEEGEEGVEEEEGSDGGDLELEGRA
ncbi:hypothetical protein Syun_019827 [Stephania yunnanensis]|uniref:Uncharacterized protein n=1 Tax=Stephania yunnanensis TaxID=152371 RepID=A0AAP0IVJ2_9MAGN